MIEILKKWWKVILFCIICFYPMYCCFSGPSAQEPEEQKQEEKQETCKGHETNIENGQIERAEKMRMRVNFTSVTYLGNCEYRCFMNVDDPGTAYSTPQNIQSTIIYKWDGNSYSFVRNE